MRYLWDKKPHIPTDNVAHPYTIAYIHGAGHCGSTLLNLLLNAHPEVIGLSEIENLHKVFLNRLDDPAIEELRNSLFWQSVFSEFERRFGAPLLIEENSIKLSGWPEYFGLRKEALDHLQNVNRALFESIAAISRMSVICDASKFLCRLHMLISAGLPVKVVDLHRDGRGVMQSYLRKGNAIQDSFNRWGDSEIGYLLLSHWISENDILYCRYEDLARYPERELRRICSFLSLNFDHRMLTEFKNTEDFGIGGNRMRKSKSTSIKLDDTWKYQLPQKERAIFWLMGGWIQWVIRLWAMIKMRKTECGQSTFDMHLVQLGYDTDVFNENAAQDSRSRQVAYAQYLEEIRPGARMTNIVLTADQTFQKDSVGNITFDPQNFYRLRHIYSLYKYLRNLHKQNPITLITTQDFHGIFWAGLAFGRLSKVPVIGQHHSDLASLVYREENFTNSYGRLYERIALWLVKAFDGVRVVNTEAKKFLESIGYKKRIGVLPVPVPISPGPIEDEHNKMKNTDVTRVLFVGRFARVKNLELWINTAYKALKSGCKLEFILVGDGLERKKLEELCDDLDIKDAVCFVGSETPRRLVGWYTGSDILLLTSKYEGFGRVIAEAMSYGMVPVCTDVSGPRDIIEQGVNGYLAEADPEKLSTLLVDLAKNHAKRVAMGERARETVQERYLPEKLRKEWVDFLLTFSL
jgi:glycosyltransferase involved in cell wall biosynthesis